MMKLCPFWKLNIKLQLHGQLIFLNGIIYERRREAEGTLLFSMLTFIEEFLFLRFQNKNHCKKSE